MYVCTYVRMYVCTYVCMYVIIMSKVSHDLIYEAFREGVLPMKGVLEVDKQKEGFYVLDMCGYIQFSF